MFRFSFILLVNYLVLTEIDFATSTECCKTGEDQYELCTDYCCNKYGISFSFSNHECCSSSYKKVSNNEAEMSDCDGWWAAHVWAAVLISLGSLGTIVAIIVCCVCCIKGCTTNNRTNGAVVVNQGQPATGLIVLSNANAHQQQSYGGQMLQDPAAYPSGYFGASGYPGPGAYPGSSGVAYPPPYTGNVTEKRGEPI